MGLSWTKKHVARMVETLDQDYEDIESAAQAALDTALAIIEERGKFAVVGQVHHTKEHGEIPPSHEAAVKVCLGLFETDTKANEAAGQLVFNTAGDQLRTWVVPTFFGTPAAWHAERRDQLAALETKADEKREQKFRESVERHEAKIAERVQWYKDMEERAGGQGWPCPTNRIKAGGCKHDPACR
jgi:hypothetical protein